MNNQSEREIDDRDRRLAHIGRLSAGIGHNIMTPLSLIMMNSDLLSMKLKDDDSLLNHLEEITKQATMISKIAETMMWKVKTEEQETPSMIQVGSLVQENLEFWMGDMFFKHKLEKDFQINTQVPPFKGVPFYFTSFIDEWILSIIERAKPLDGGNVEVKVDVHGPNHFFILFEDSLPPHTGEQLKVLKSGCNHPSSEEHFPALCRLLINHPAEIDFSAGQDGKTAIRLTWNL